MGKWLGLMIGNSRLHWAYCQTDDESTSIQHTWDSQHWSAKDATLSAEEQAHIPSLRSLNAILPSELEGLLSDHETMPLIVASVVPTQTQYWRTYLQTRVITLNDIPLVNLYPTLGIDRALALVGAWSEHQTSALVIDGGTAWTITGVDADGQFIGGAIVPGLRVQMRSLHQQTAALPKILLEEGEPIARWQTNTPDSIRSGVWYSLLAGIESFVWDWLHQYPDSAIVFTGGDGKRLWGAMKEAIASQWPHTKVFYDPQIIFKGMSQL